MALSAIVLVLTLCLAGIAAMVAQIRVTDAAGEAARLLARGDRAAAETAVERLAPHGSVFTVTGTGLFTVRVEAPPLGGILPGVRVASEVVASNEQGVGQP